LTERSVLTTAEFAVFVDRIIDESPPTTSPGNVTNYSPLLPEDLAMSNAVIYRVFKLPASLLTAMREKRDQVETTNARFLAEAIDSHLPNLVKELQRLGFGVHGGDQQVARLPFSESVTLSLLKDAAETVGLPSTKLLELCLVAAVQPHSKQRQRRRRPKSEETADTTSKQTKRHRRR
jgi:hypothetical protein